MNLHMRRKSFTFGLGLALTVAACNGDDTATSDTATTTGGESESDGTTADPTTTTTTTTSSTTDDSTATTTTTTTSSTTSAETDTTTTGVVTDTSSTTEDPTTGTTADTDTTTDTTGDTTTDTDTTGDTDGVENTIYEIQGGEIVIDAPVDVDGVIVTGVSTAGFYAQEPGGGEYSGVWVYVGAMGPDITGLKIGDEVDITGVYAEFNDLTEIDASMGTVVATGVMGLPVEPAIVTVTTLSTPDTAEPWEGVFVRIEGAPLGVVDEPGFSEFLVADQADAVLVDNFLYSVYDNPADFPDFAVGASFTAIAGPINYTFGAHKIAPRMKEDLEGYTPPMQQALGVEDMIPGDLVISEVMYNPTCANDACEWIEVYNATGVDVNLKGLVIQDELMNPMAQGLVAVDLFLAADGYAWLGKNDVMTWPYDGPPHAFFGNKPDLNNGGAGDLIVVRNTKEILDQTAKWAGQGGADAGISWHLKPDQIDAVANDDPANWCYALATFDSTNESGSPGAANEAVCNPNF